MVNQGGSNISPLSQYSQSLDRAVSLQNKYNSTTKPGVRFLNIEGAAGTPVKKGNQAGTTKNSNQPAVNQSNSGLSDQIKL